MADHEHVWELVPGRPSGYVCACGTTGYRLPFGPFQNRAITPHKNQPGFKIPPGVGEPTARDGTGWRKPSLDDYDKRGK